MTAAENLATSETTYDYPLADIREPSIPNYRTTFEGMDELTASVKERGIRVPLVLRPAPSGDGHELAIGARRREAAKRAGLTSVPVFIRELTDDQVLEERAIENLQRVNPDPLDEAAAFKLLVSRGYSEQQLADKLGQPLRYVAQRLALNDLCKDAQKAMRDERISLAVAILIAALPTDKMQKRALEQVAPEWGGEGQMLLKDARAQIEESVMLELKDAPFKLDDAELVSKAGPCTTCKKRTGNQAQLFADASSGDLCLDEACHKSKVDALWQIRVKNAKADGVNVLSVKASSEALRASKSYSNGEFIRLSEKVGVGKTSMGVKKLLGKDLPPVTLARDEQTGVAVELVQRKVVEAAIRKAAPKEKAGSAAQPDARAKKEREAERLQAEVRRRTMQVMTSTVESLCNDGQISKALLRILAQGTITAVWNDIGKRVADRRGLPLVDEEASSSKKGAKRQQPRLSSDDRLERHLQTLDEGGLVALLFELLMGRAAPGKWSEAADCYVAACAELKVDVKALEATIKAEKQAKANKTPKAAKASSKKGVTHFIAAGGGGNACGKPGKVRVGEGGTTTAERVTCPECRAAMAKAKPAKPPKVKPADLPTGWPDGSVTVPPKAAKKKAAKKVEPKPVNPATGQVVHYVDPTGLSQTGVACGGTVGDGKGIITDEAEKVTCKSCRRTAGLDQADDAEPKNPDPYGADPEGEE